jgi:hypothetical protein
MAERFDFDSIYEDETWCAVYENAEGYQQKFYELVRDECEKSNFPNLEVTINEYVTGGLVFNRESTKMLKIKARNSAFKKYEIYYRAQLFGNFILYTRMECMERSVFESLSSKTGLELKALLKKKCKNMAQYEEFVAIDELADILFYKAIMKLDPEFKERKMLKTK